MPVLAEKPLPEMTERLISSTMIIPTELAEFRTAALDRPETEIAYQFRLPDARAAAFDQALRDGIADDWTVPFWHERTRRLDLSAGQTVIAVSTSADYRAGGEAMIWQGCDAWEIATIASVGAGSITLSAGLSASYSSAAVMPAHTAFISAPVAIGRGKRGLVEFGVEFMLRETADLAASVWGAYQGLEVMGCSGGYLSRLEGTLTPNIEYVGRGFGPVVMEALRPVPDSFFAVEVAGHAWDIKRFLHQVRGQDYPFWVKSWGGALKPTAGSAGATLFVETSRPAADLVGRHINAAGQLREIVAAVEGGATQTLTLDAALSPAITVFDPVSLMTRVRADTERAEIAHIHGFTSRFQLPVTEDRAA